MFLLPQGGRVDDADTDQKWNSEYLPNDSATFLQTSKGELKANRLAAIRELFEESGILCANSSTVKSFFLLILSKFCLSFVACFLVLFLILLSCFVQSLSSARRERCRIVPNFPYLEQFRDEIHKDAKKFYSICKEHDLIPDIWRIHPWSRW